MDDFGRWPRLFFGRLNLLSSLLTSSRIAAVAGRLRPHRRSLALIAFLLMAPVVVAFTMNPVMPVQPGGPPANYRQVASVDLKVKPHEGDAVYEFAIQTPQTISFFVVLNDADVQYLDVHLAGPDYGTRSVLHAAELKLSYSGMAWQDYLKPGDYQLIVNSPKGAGKLLVYTNSVARFFVPREMIRSQ